MCWYKSIPLLLMTAPCFAGDGYIIGAGLEGDSSDGLAVSVLGDFGITEKTWLSAAFARNDVDLANSTGIDTVFADIGIDHWFKPIGIRAGVSYWGDNDTLESSDWRTSLYWRSEKFSVAGDYEFRDFTFDLPTVDAFPGRRASFEATGVGISARVDVSDAVSLGVSGIDYDYDANLRLDRNRGILELLAFSRLSLINSLVDYRANATLGVDVGVRRWELDVGTWQGEVDGGKTTSATIRFLTPLGGKGDIEFALGVDDSELYGEVTFLSVFLYFYGGV